MNSKEEEERLLKHNGYGDRSLSHKLKLELPTCSIKMLATESLINKI